MTTATRQPTEAGAAAVARGTSIGRRGALLRPDAEADWWCLPWPDDEPGLWRLLDDRGSPARWRGAPPAGTQVSGEDRR